MKIFMVNSSIFSVVKGYSPIQERVFVAGGRLPDPKSFEIFKDLIKCEFE